MGVYIRDMEMPKSCGECQLESYCNLWAITNWGAERNPDCPLVDAPEPPNKNSD